MVAKAAGAVDAKREDGKLKFMLEKARISPLTPLYERGGSVLFSLVKICVQPVPQQKATQSPPFPKGDLGGFSGMTSGRFHE